MNLQKMFLITAKRTQRCSQRRGASAVEFAIVAPPVLSAGLRLYRIRQGTDGSADFN